NDEVNRQALYLRIATEKRECSGGNVFLCAAHTGRGLFAEEILVLYEEEGATANGGSLLPAVWLRETQKHRPLLCPRTTRTEKAGFDEGGRSGSGCASNWNW